MVAGYASDAAPPSGAHFGVLIVRVWTEGDTEDELLKARVIASIGCEPQSDPEYAVGLESILEKARRWLVNFQHRAAAG